jgi:hypothetical protein
LSAIIKTQDEYSRAAHIITAISAQRLRMRNEQFGHPLTEAELTKLDERAQRVLAHHL